MKLCFSEHPISATTSLRAIDHVINRAIVCSRKIDRSEDVFAGSLIPVILRLPLQAVPGKNLQRPSQFQISDYHDMSQVLGVRSKYCFLF